MRAIILVLTILIAAGCASDDMRRDWAAEAVKLELSQEEIISIAQQARDRFKWVVLRFERFEKDAIAVYMADKPDRPHGIIVVFRKVDGVWREDPKSQGQWIV